MKPKPLPAPEYKAADDLLGEIRDAQKIIAHTEEDMEAELAQLKASSSVWQSLQDTLRLNKERLQMADQALKAQEIANQALFFGNLNSCRVTLPHGVLIYDRADYVVKPRKVNVLERLERYGFEEAIKRTAAVDWEVLENKEEWPDEVLAFLGTRRESKETFGYELNESEDQGKD